VYGTTRHRLTTKTPSLWHGVPWSAWWYDTNVREDEVEADAAPGIDTISVKVSSPTSVPAS